MRTDREGLGGRGKTLDRLSRVRRAGVTGPVEARAEDWRTTANALERMSASPPATPGRLKPPGRPHFLSTRSLTPTTSLTYPKVAPPPGHAANKLSISSDAPSESSSIRSGHGALFAAGEDDAGLGTGAEGNAGPSVHLSDPVLDDEDGERQDSDESDGPPPWVLNDAKGKSKAKPAGAEDQRPEIKSPVFLKQIGASQSLLQEQLRKGGAATVRRTSSTFGRPPSRAQDTPSEAATLASAEVAKVTKRKYYILTSAGKPVWSSEDEDVVDVTGQAGVMQAIVSIFADDGDRLRCVVASPSRPAACRPLAQIYRRGLGQDCRLDQASALLLRRFRLGRAGVHRTSHLLRSTGPV